MLVISVVPQVATILITMGKKKRNCPLDLQSYENHQFHNLFLAIFMQLHDAK